MKKAQWAAVGIFILAAAMMFGLGVKQGDWSDFIVGALLLGVAGLTFALFRKEGSEIVIAEREQPTMLDMRIVRRVRR